MIKLLRTIGCAILFYVVLANSAQAQSPTIIMYAPAPNQSFVTQAGDVYQSSSINLIVNVASQADVSDLLAQGCWLLVPRNNVSTIRGPLSTDDFTAGYGVGSQWTYTNSGSPQIYVLTSMTTSVGSASWVQISSGANGTVNVGVSGELGYYAANGSAISGNSNTSITAATLSLGNDGAIQGNIVLAGGTSGHVEISPSAAAGGAVLTLPASTGTLIGSGNLDSTLTYSSSTLKCTTATTSQLGCVKPDGTSILISGGVISAPGTGGGSVTSVGLSLPAPFTVSGSPVTTNGTLTATYVNESTNLFFASPGSGSPGAPTFRNIVQADLIPTGYAFRLNTNHTYYADASAGSDSNDCLAASTGGGHGPCLTIQHVVNIVEAGDPQGTNVTINLNSTPFAGAFINGNLPLAGLITIDGHGSNIIDSGPNCYGVHASNGAVVIIENVTLNVTTCGVGADILADTHALIIVGGGVIFFGAPSAIIQALNYGQISISSSTTIAGSSVYAFDGITHAAIGFGPPSVISFIGGPVFSTAVVGMIDNSLFSTDGGSFSGSATGPKYELDLNSEIDGENPGTPSPPGSEPGSLASGSYYLGAQSPCVGGAVGCTVSTGYSGLGSAGTVTVESLSTDHFGVVDLVAGGSGIGNSAAFYLGTFSNLWGETHSGTTCTFSPNVGGSGVWAASASIQGSYTSNFVDPNIAITVYNGGATFTSGNTYKVSYHCD